MCTHVSTCERMRVLACMRACVRACIRDVFTIKIFDPGAKTIKKNTNSTQNKSQTHSAEQYKVTSFLSTDCELSTNPCSKNGYSLGPRLIMIIIKIIVLYFIQIRHTDDFPSTGIPASSIKA